MVQDPTKSVDDTEDEEEETKSYLCGFWCPLEISSGKTTLWTNPLPNLILFELFVLSVKKQEGLCQLILKLIWIMIKI